MPLIRKEENEISVTGVWKIDESASELKSMQELTIPEDLFYSSIKNETRKKHWLSYRLILKEFPEFQGPFDYDEFGKPSLPRSGCHVSVSHSGDYSALIISREIPVGIDIEKIRDRIDRVKERFLSEEELSYVEKQDQLTVLTILWGAKEAIYKIHGKPEMEFQDIFVLPFTLKDDEGRFSAVMNIRGDKTSYELSYSIFDGYVLVCARQKI